MDIKKVQDADLENKKILVRVDFNVAIDNGIVGERFKIEASKKTLDYLFAQKNNKIALMSHFGRPEKEFDENLTLKNIVAEAEKLLGKKVKFIGDCKGEEVKKGLENLREGEILLLENVRFYQEEVENNEKFAKQLAQNFDIFINDAFSVCHRDQASVTGVTKFLPAFAGLRLQKEIENLDKVKKNPDRPAVAVVGGAKIETKLPLIESFEKNYDYILVGGKVACEAIDEGIDFSSKVILPIDFAEDRGDIGEKTIEKFKNIISQAKTVAWNGPMGKFEKPPFDKGTREILSAIIESGAFSLVGGGESIQFLEENNALSRISFVSTGGGAMLEYLSGNDLPGIEVLKKL